MRLMERRTMSGTPASKTRPTQIRAMPPQKASPCLFTRGSSRFSGWTVLLDVDEPACPGDIGGQSSTGRERLKGIAPSFWYGVDFMERFRLVPDVRAAIFRTRVRATLWARGE